MPTRDASAAPRARRGPGLTARQFGAARAVLALLVAALVAAFVGLLLGEYPFTGAMPWVAGVLLGYIVAEIVVTLGHRRGVLFGVAAAVFAAGGLLWAGWISSGDGKQPYSAMAWVAAGLAVVVAFLRAGPRWRSAPRPGSTAAAQDASPRP